VAALFRFHLPAENLPRDNVQVFERFEKIVPKQARRGRRFGPRGPRLALMFERA
jgi:hypothetical protein